MTNHTPLPAPHRLQVKVFTRDGGSIPSEACIHIFHRWIQTQAVDGLAIDVADYSHVPDGPGIMLVGHEFDYAFDEVGAPGLRYVRKKTVPDTFPAALNLVLLQLMKGARLLEEESSEPVDISFDLARLEVTVLDRRLYPNRADTVAEITGALSGMIQSALKVGEVGISRVYDDARYPLTLRLELAPTPALDSLLHSLPAQLSPAELT